MEEQNWENNNGGEVNQNPGYNDGQAVPENVVSQAPQAPMAPPIPENVNQIKYAGFWIRWAAAFIDGIVVMVIAVPISIAFVLLSGNSLDSNMPTGMNFLGTIIAWAYYILMTDVYQATLGKKAMGIIVVAEDLNKASLGKIALRETVGKLVSAFTLMIGYLMVAFTDRKRGLHDMIGGTVVVYKDPNAKSNRGMIIGIVAAFVVAIVVILIVLSSIVLMSLGSARGKASVAAFKAMTSGLATTGILACDEDVLSPSSFDNDITKIGGKYLDAKTLKFTAGTTATDCGPSGKGKFSFTIDSVGLSPKCTATVTDKGTTFDGC